MKSSILMWLKRNEVISIVYTILVGIIIIGTLINPLLIKGRNIGNILEQATALGFVSIGQTVVILTGGIDLSVGAIISLTDCILSVIMHDNIFSLIVSLVLVMVMGAFIGAVNGMGITKLKIPPFVMTLGMMSVINGVALKFRPIPGGEIPFHFATFLTSRFYIIPLGTLIWAILLWVNILLLTRTRFGRNIYAVGGNEQTAELSGISTSKIKIGAYVISGFFASLAGIYVAARMGTGDPTVGSQFSLDSITAVVLGGISLFGGRGSLVGTIAAVFILSILSNILNLAGVMSFYQYVLKGAILLVTVLFYGYRN